MQSETHKVSSVPPDTHVLVLRESNLMDEQLNVRILEDAKWEDFYKSLLRKYYPNTK